MESLRNDSTGMGGGILSETFASVRRKADEVRKYQQFIKESTLPLSTAKLAKGDVMDLGVTMDASLWVDKYR